MRTPIILTSPALQSRRHDGGAAVPRRHERLGDSATLVVKAILALRAFARYHEQMNVLRLRGERELYEFEGLLAGDDPVRLVLHDDSRDFGMVLNWSNESFTLLRSDGTIRAYPYSHVLSADALEPGADYDAVVDALEAGDFIASAEILPFRR